MPLSSDIKFQKTLALAASASNHFEVEAAELAARRLMEQHNIDPTDIPDVSLYDRTNFANNVLLKKLRDEWRERHPPLPQPLTQKSEHTTQSPRITFNINGFTKYTKQANRRQSPQKYADNTVVTPEMLEKIHAMFDDGIAPVEIRHAFGLTRGQIAGIKNRYSHVQNSRHQQTAPAPTGNADDSST